MNHAFGASIFPSLWFEIGGTKGDKIVWIPRFDLKLEGPGEVRLFESFEKEESTKYEKKKKKKSKKEMPFFSFSFLERVLTYYVRSW